MHNPRPPANSRFLSHYRCRGGGLRVQIRGVEGDRQDRTPPGTGGSGDPSGGAAALAIFDWSQQAADGGLVQTRPGGANILDTVCLNREAERRKSLLEIRMPFRELSERRSLQNNCGNGWVFRYGQQLLPSKDMWISWGCQRCPWPHNPRLRSSCQHDSSQLHIETRSVAHHGHDAQIVVNRRDGGEIPRPCCRPRQSPWPCRWRSGRSSSGSGWSCRPVLTCRCRD